MVDQVLSSLLLCARRFDVSARARHACLVRGEPTMHRIFGASADTFALSFDEPRDGWQALPFEFPDDDPDVAPEDKPTIHAAFAFIGDESAGPLIGLIRLPPMTREAPLSPAHGHD